MHGRPLRRVAVGRIAVTGSPVSIELKCQSENLVLVRVQGLILVYYRHALWPFGVLDAPPKGSRLGMASFDLVVVERSGCFCPKRAATASFPIGFEKGRTMTSNDEKVLDARVRRAARRAGLQVKKSRRRHPCAHDLCGYMLVDSRNCCWRGSYFELTADDVLKLCSDL